MSDSSSSATHPSLFGRLRTEEAGAWGEFVQRYAPRIYGWAESRGLADADCQDVTQEVLLKLFDRLKTFEYDRTKCFRGYLHTLTKNAVTDYVESRRRQGQGSGDDTVARRLETEEARADLSRQIEQEYDLELLEIACKYVRVQKSTYWERCWRALPEILGGKNESVEEAAAKLGIRSALISQALWQVKTALRRQVERLEGNARHGGPFPGGGTEKDGPAPSEDLP